MAKASRRSLLAGAGFGAAGLASTPHLAAALVATSPMRAVAAGLAALNELH